MAGCSRGSLPTWMTAAASRVDLTGGAASSHQGSSPSPSSSSSSQSPSAGADQELGMVERALSAAGAAFVSAIIVNPLDVAKTRLQAQAAGVLYNHPPQMAALGPDAEGFGRLWRGTNAGLALAVPTAYKEFRPGVKPPGMWKTMVGVLSPLASSSQNVQNYRALWTGVGAQLARDVPFSAICWSTLEPIRRKLLGLVEEGNAASVVGANFAAGFVAGSLAAGATCPLDVAKTRRQIEKDTEKAMRMTTRQTLTEIWSSGGLKGLFTGVGPRVARAGPSVGIVISCYEVVKYALHQRNAS
ncbi:hypothetical protein PR202_ga20831 [Eleusine coracana subsp. coracana]|uniref:Mitochondrial carrier protein n=1 Tax=Eleusine coracana subsp. coracana TaxID=191504 RepID=A0AAV5CZ32_ELECO|nr:hypothetical protein PR202_ga20831 [Eleusine coracana subsp. coracana]